MIPLEVNNKIVRRRDTTNPTSNGMSKTRIEIKILLASIFVLVILYVAWVRPVAFQYDTNIPAPEKVEKKVVHTITPEPVKALYMTSYVAAVPTWREKILKLIDDTELNALVIDIKDYTGVNVLERAPDIADFIEELHKHNVYVIGRVSVFQDQQYVREHPEYAVRRKDNGDLPAGEAGVWRDRKGIAWLDPSSHEVWDYIVGIARNSYYKLGFDEINFDYIRFPSDGDMSNVYYEYSSTSASVSKSDKMKSFYKYLDQELRSESIPISADLFGMTTTNTDDLGIGQVLENALMHFDYVSPMVYPSHYPPTFNGWANPNKVPYEIVNFSMIKAATRASLASTSPYKLRPWLQDFDYGGDYGEAEVRAQIQAVYDAGLTSWMLWDPGVKYTPSALNPAIIE